jgi:hypothetical protein
MADNSIPPGLTIRKTTEEIKLFDSVTKSIKDQANELAGIYKDKEFSVKLMANFEENLKKDIADKKEEHDRYIEFLKKQGATQDELEKQIKSHDQELKKFTDDSRKEYNKTINETQNQIDRLKEGVDKSLDSYKNFQRQVSADIKKLKDGGASSAEISAYLKKNADFYKENTQEMKSALDKVKDELAELSRNENITDDQKYLLRKQLLALEKSYDLEESHFNKQYKIFEEMNDELSSLQRSQEEADKKEKRQQKGKFKDTLLATMLGPFRLLTDPISKMLHNRDTFEQFQHKTEQKEEKFEIYEKSRKELNKLADEERENSRFEALMSGDKDEASKFEKPSIVNAGVNALIASFTPAALLTGLKQLSGFGEPSFEQYQAQANRAEDIENLVSALKTVTKNKIKGIPGALFDKREQGHDAIEGPVAAETQVDVLAPEPALEPAPTLALPSTLEPAPIPELPSALEPAPIPELPSALEPAPIPELEAILTSALESSLEPALTSALESVLAPALIFALESVPTPAPVLEPAPAQLILPSPATENAALEFNHAGLPTPVETNSLMAGTLSNQQETPLGIDGTSEEEALEGSLLDRISPNQASLLAKGGVVGAGVVFLARKLGLITDAFEDVKKKNKEEEGGLGNIAIDFMKENGMGMLKVAAPLAVMALGGVAIAKGMQMQERDTDDAQKYFDEGNTARGIETAILGDRARLTEENANQELGRTAGKTALLAGGAGLVAAGGIGTAAMVGTVASAGGVAAAGGLGAVGTAGMAAMGAALPPALIAAAVITAGMVVAKGTQEAFELGWDKNQAAIQKELSDTMLSEDSSTIDKIKAGAISLWKGLTGALAGGIREAGKVLDAETVIQNEKQLNFIKGQAAAGNEGYQRLMEMMQSEQFKALSEAEQKTMMQAEGLYDEFKASQEATQKTLGEHLMTAGRTIGGFFTGLVDTTMEGMRGKETAVWEKAALKGMENMTGEDRDRLSNSQSYQEAVSSGKDHKGAMEAAYLSESREKAVARGDLRKDGMAIQEGNWLAGMAAGGAVGGIPGAVTGALGGAAFGKYLGFGDTGKAYKEKQSDEEYRQTFEYSKRKTELMQKGMSSEEADLAAIEEQNALYEQALTLRLKQSKDYKKEFDKQLKEGKSIKEAEDAALRVARDIKRNTMTTTELAKSKFTEMGETLKGWAGNIGSFFKDKFSAAGQGMPDLGNMVAEGAKGVWDAVSEWFSGIWGGIKDKVSSILGTVGDGLDWAKGKAGDAGNWVKEKAGGIGDWFSGLFSGGEDSSGASAQINDGIVTKEGKVIELSPDDNIYATKNELRGGRDQETQSAMPDVPRTPAEFTDAGIVAAIQVLTDVLKNKEMSTTVVSHGESMNFDQYRMADALI